MQRIRADLGEALFSAAGRAVTVAHQGYTFSIVQARCSLFVGLFMYTVGGGAKGLPTLQSHGCLRAQLVLT